MNGNEKNTDQQGTVAEQASGDATPEADNRVCLGVSFTQGVVTSIIAVGRVNEQQVQQSLDKARGLLMQV